MGIDVYMSWEGQTEEEHEAQLTGFNTMVGGVGYLRESYHGGPYATQSLLPECWASDDGRARIPAAVLRARLEGEVVEPTADAREAMASASAFASRVHGLFSEMVGEGQMSPPGHGAHVDAPLTVVEAIEQRIANVYPDAEPGYADQIKASFRSFVELAERKEAETGQPVTIEASY